MYLSMHIGLWFVFLVVGGVGVICYFWGRGDEWTASGKSKGILIVKALACLHEIPDDRVVEPRRDDSGHRMPFPPSRPRDYRRPPLLASPTHPCYSSTNQAAPAVGKPNLQVAIMRAPVHHLVAKMPSLRSGGVLNVARRSAAPSREAALARIQEEADAFVSGLTQAERLVLAVQLHDISPEQNGVDVTDLSEEQIIARLMQA